MSKAAELAKMGEVITNNQIGGRRNIVINGAMNVSQRSTSETGLGASAGYFTLDRFKMHFANTAGRLTMTQTADGPSGFKNCLKLACTTADTSIAAGEIASIQTRFEGQDLQQIKKGTADAETITVSFYVKGNASATYTCELYDNDNSRHIGQEFSVTTSWTRVVLTFAADTSGALDDDNANSFQINWNLHAGSTYTGGTFSSNTWGTTTNQRIGDNQTSFFDSTDRTFFITGVQMEIGSTATPFEHRSYGEEFTLCQRYYYKMLAGTTYAKFGVGRAWSADDVACTVYLPTPMRTIATSGVIETSTIGSNFGVAGVGTNLTAITISEFQANNQVVGLNVAYASDGFSIGTIYQFESDNNTTAYIAFNAEL